MKTNDIVQEHEAAREKMETNLKDCQDEAYIAHITVPKSKADLGVLPAALKWVSFEAELGPAEVGWRCVRIPCACADLRLCSLVHLVHARLTADPKVETESRVCDARSNLRQRL